MQIKGKFSNLFVNVENVALNLCFPTAIYVIRIRVHITASRDRAKSGTGIIRR